MTVSDQPTEKIGEFLDRRLREVGRLSQIVIAMDSTGALRCEMAGDNGARRKIDLPSTFARRNPEIMELLKSDQHRIKAQVERMAELRREEQTAQRTSVEDEMQRRQAIFDAKDRKRREWLDSLPADQRAVEEAKIDRQLQKFADESNARAKSIFHYIVEHHTIRLARRVIPDVNRQPRALRKVVIEMADGRLIPGYRAGSSPRADGKTPSVKRRTNGPIDLSQALDI